MSKWKKLTRELLRKGEPRMLIVDEVQHLQPGPIGNSGRP
ncbi:hypothetical protein AB4Z48_37365 [Cupriavidus sp. 2TAF22]